MMGGVGPLRRFLPLIWFLAADLETQDSEIVANGLLLSVVKFSEDTESFWGTARLAYCWKGEDFFKANLGCEWVV